MRNTIIITAVAIAVTIALLLGGGYLLLRGKVYTIQVHEDALQETMNSNLPIENTYLLVVKVSLINPRVDLIDGSDRFNAGLDVTVEFNLNMPTPVFQGSVDASGSLDYDPGTGGLHVIDPVIESLSIQGLPEEHTARVEEAVTEALARYWKNYPVYVLRATDAKKAAARLVLRSVKVDHQHLVVELGL